MRKNTVIVVVGPTASGKSRLAVDICKKINGEVVSGDSMQIYRGMDIGTAKATADEQQGVTHHLLDIKEPTENYSLDDFLKNCEHAVDEIISRGKTPVIAGGTGLYISSFVNRISLSEAKADDDYRSFLDSLGESSGNLTLKQLLFGIDPESYIKLKTNDRKRIIRALEVYRTTGKTISRSREEKDGEKKYNFILFGLNCKNRDILYGRINHRVDIMMESGLEDEARRLYGQELSSTASQAIGYKELFAYFQGETTLVDAVDNIKQNSRNYAKRQLTWFGKEKDIVWYDISENNYDEILKNAMEHIVKIENM